MASIRRLILILLVLCIISTNLGLSAFAESILEFPTSTISIEEEAFYGTQSLETVVLPEGILEIRNHAFANSSLKAINLPASITFIADDAFEDSQLSTVFATQGTYSYRWAVDHHYIDDHPVSGHIYHFAGITNQGHYYTYGEPADLSARMESTVALKKIKASVFCRGGLNDGLKACSDVVVLCDSNVFSFDTSYTDLENGIDCESLPIGKFRLVLFAELIDGRTYNVSEYDFEVVNRCSSVTLVDNKLQLECGDISLLYPIIEPSTATYPTLFHYFSSDADIVTIDENGFLQAQNKSGTAIVTVYSWDWYASTLCEITVYDAEKQEDCPVSIEVWSNAGSGNPGHYHQYGRSEEFTGRITSTVAIKEIRSKVVYRGGDNDGQSAYDSNQAKFVGDANTYSINIGSSVLNTRLKFGEMPCAPLRLFLYAELIDGSIYQIYKYDFEIVEKCTSITLNRYDKILPFGSTFQIIPSVSPSNATYTNSFHYESSSPYYASVDQTGLVTCYDRKGTATITVYSEDWAVSTTCIITVADSVLDETPRIIDAVSNSAIYESSYDRSIWLNFTPVAGSYLYDIYRATSASGPFEYLGATEGANENEWWIGPFNSGCTALDNNCNENVIYYYKIQARNRNNARSDFSNIMVAHSGENVLYEPVWIDSSIDEVPDYVNAASSSRLVLNGTITSNYSMSLITATITNEWKTTMLSNSAYPNNKIYSISSLYLNISSFPSGLYKITVKAYANEETKIVVDKWFYLSNPSIQATTLQLQQDVLQFVNSNTANIFIPESEVQSYFNQMGTWDIILMGLSDYQGIATSAIKDLLSDSEYNSYMEMKYESQIIKILDSMYTEGKVARIDISTSVTDFIDELNKLTKSGNNLKINEINNIFLSKVSDVDWDQLGTLLIIKDGCKRLGDLFGNIDACAEYIQMICELFSDHSKDLEALNVISTTYNPNHDAAFSAALERIRDSYKTQFGSSLKMLFDKIEKELTKKAVKKITKELLDETVGSLYTLANTITELSVKLFGIEDAGKTRVQFIAQYNTLTNMRQAFRNVHSEVMNYNNMNGSLPTEEQINQLQVTFMSARQALIQLYETMEELDDEDNIGLYEYYIDNAKKMTMPGVDKIQ